MLAYEAEEKDYDAPEQPRRRRVSSALAGEAEKEEGAGCSGMPAQAEKEAEYHHAPEKEEAAGCLGAPVQAEKEAECHHAPEKEEAAGCSGAGVGGEGGGVPPCAREGGPVP